MIDSGARAAPEPKPKRATKDGHSSFFGPRHPSGSLERNISENLQFWDLSWSHSDKPINEEHVVRMQCSM